MPVGQEDISYVEHSSRKGREIKLLSYNRVSLGYRMESLVRDESVR